MSEVKDPAALLAQASAAIAAARGEAKKHVSGALKLAAQELFAAHANVASIRWEQYTPHFNDGDACVFSVHDPSVSFNDGTVGEYGSEDYYDEWSIRKAHPTVAEAMNKFQSSINDWSEYLQAALGDHAQVEITRDLAVTVEEYYHD